LPAAALYAHTAQALATGPVSAAIANANPIGNYTNMSRRDYLFVAKI